MLNPDDVVVIVGTRPEAIKLAGVVRLLGPAARVVHTGQHYDAAMWRDVLSDLSGVQVQHSLFVGGRSRGEQIGSATQELTRYLLQAPARAVVVQGDTNSTLAGALAASTLGIPVVHVEAGLRSHDRAMPEELNRLLVDTVADLCCAPVPGNADQLRREGVHPERIVVTGNTLAGALHALLPAEPERTAILDRFGLAAEEFVLTTVHRAGNVDDRDTLGGLVRALGRLAELVEVVLPLHPHTGRRIEQWGLGGQLNRVKILPPLTPRQFLALEAGARLILSDSGGVQEEACFLRRPLLILRDSTERPELLDGWSRLLGADEPVDAVLSAWKDSRAWLSALRDRPFPYPEDDACGRIVAEIDRRWPPAGQEATGRRPHR